MKQVLWRQTSSSAWKWLPDTSCIHLTISSQSKIKRPCQLKADDIWHHLTPHIPTCLGKDTQEVGHQEVTRLVTGHSLRIFFAHQATQGIQQQQLTWDEEMPAGCKQHDPSGAASELRKERKRNLLGLLIAGLYAAIWFCDPRSENICRGKGRILCWWPAAVPSLLGAPNISSSVDAHEIWDQMDQFCDTPLATTKQLFGNGVSNTSPSDNAQRGNMDGWKHDESWWIHE